jgi:hypothetical protein
MKTKKEEKYENVITTARGDHRLRFHIEVNAC